ncbi:Imm49 family immunity protein [Spirosoma linguale]|uniref:Immunity protein 49 n=1 Tax=Spirosoma linguale (strain ATCC 33905 / DSM 74 / LMG 10896 / Claus 1) TaxID=504472 RepID=D2QLJ7_SPILD|nr:hypothetical protein Slin_4305 [Spirosoma linguale DSM 74]
MKIVKRHLANEVDFAKVQDQFYEFNLPYYENRQHETLEYKLTQFGIERIVKNYINSFYEAYYLKNQLWAETFLYFGNALNQIIFSLSLHENQAVTLHYDNESLTTNGWLVGLRTSYDGKNLSTPEIYNCWTWRETAHFAFLLRDSALLSMLQAVDTHTMFERITFYNTLNPDSIDPLWHELYIQLMAGHNSQAATICADMIEKLEQQPASYLKNLANFEDNRQRLAMLTLPFLRCLDAYLCQNAAQFEQRLYDALLQHKAFCELPLKKSKGSLGIPNSNISHLFVSMPLLAVCSLAYDAGFGWDVESDYIPTWLIAQTYQYQLRPTS